jgi:hypothetical protein|tara:strand:+ start:430 stop:678 length:249 start_codon:yes stop_codon:yes gene_type:complete
MVSLEGPEKDRLGNAFGSARNNLVLYHACGLGSIQFGDTCKPCVTKRGPRRVSAHATPIDLTLYHHEFLLLGLLLLTFGDIM